MNKDDNPLPQYNFQKGALLLVDKPKDWTSFDVVNKIRSKIRYQLGIKKIKVGHSGTLDPMATGLMIVCTGKFTKKLHDLQGLSKEYTGTFTLGATTPSYDAETEVDATYSTEQIDSALLEQARKQFLGAIEQVPPMFSAIKVDGQPLYKKARKGVVLDIKPRPVSIEAFDMTDIRMPEIDFRVACSKGTYIRSLAYDFGKALQSGAYLSALRRTKVGDFRIEDAWNLEDLVQYIEGGENALSIAS
ncbi:MAG: tRNA pseudouridine(55) synthase TruB [Bacteroidota bacterium]